MNIMKLKGSIIANGYSIKSLASKIGINKSTLYRKISGNGHSFTIGEVEAIVSALGLSNEEAKNIFLP